MGSVSVGRYGRVGGVGSRLDDPGGDESDRGEFCREGGRSEVFEPAGGDALQNGGVGQARRMPAADADTEERVDGADVYVCEREVPDRRKEDD